MFPLKRNNFSNLNVWIVLVMMLGGFLLYTPAFQSKGFYFDDHFSIESNKIIKRIDVPNIFNAFNTRFLVGLSFALNYKWFALQPVGYRLINLFIHVLNAFLVYLLIKSTLYLYSERKPIFFCRLEWPAFFASMLFLCHPIQTESVNFITQRFVLMGTFFYLLTLFLYVQYRCKFKKEYLIASGGSALAAMFCKEFVVTLPLMLALYEFYFLDALPEPWWKHCRRILPFFIIVLIVPLLLLRTPPEAVDVANIADSRGELRSVNNHIDITRANGSIGRQEYFLTELNVVCTYVRLLFLPINQNLDYDYPVSSKVDNKTALCGVFLLCLLVLAVIAYKSYRIISFAIVWFFIALSVESSFIPIGDVITEYRLYLPSVGFVCLVMSLIYMWHVDIKVLNVIAAVVLICFSILTYQRNRVWKDEFSLWNDTVQKSPHKARPYNGRGILYFEQGNFTQAMADYNKAIGIDPYFSKAYDNRGALYEKQGNWINALADYNKSIEINPKNAISYNNRGLIYYEEGNLSQAMLNYNKAIEIDPHVAEFYKNRGVIYDKQGNLTKAMLDCNKAIEINPKDAQAYNNRGTIYQKQGDFIQAMSDYNKSIERNPSFLEAYYNRGSLYYKQDDLNQARLDYSKVIEINPLFAEAYVNRAITYYQLKKYDMAWADVHKAEELRGVVNPQLINALKQVSGQDK